MKGYSHGDFLTRGTPEEGLDFVSVLQPVPYTGKHFGGYLTAKCGHMGGRQRNRCKQRKRDGREEERGKKGRQDRSGETH